MKFYNQSDLFWLLVSAARNADLAPDPALLQRYRENRVRAAAKALRSKNIFLYTEGTRPSVSLSDVTTIYTQPTGVRLMVVGYSDNLFYGSTQQANAAANAYAEVIFPQSHRVRVVGREGRALSEDFVVAQSGASGQPRFTSTTLPVPFVLEPDEQIAIDLGYDTAMSAPAQIPAQAFTFFCVKVSERLTSDDLDTIEDVKRYVAAHDYQRGIFLNAASLGHTDVRFSTAIAGGIAQCETRPANGPLMISGFCTTLLASTLLITDLNDGHSFSLNRAMRSSSLNVADTQDNVGLPPVAVVGAASIWEHYWEFPIPHLLKSGSALRVDVVNGGTDATATARVDSQTGNWILFQGSTV